MAKAKGMLESIMKAAQPAAQSRAPEPTRESAPAKKRPHVSLYLDEDVQWALKDIANARRLKLHDLYLEGIDLLLAQHGRPSLAEFKQKRDNEKT